MEEPIRSYEGEVFSRINIYKDRIEFQDTKKSYSLPIHAFPCLKIHPCRDKNCRHFIKFKEFDNCCLNITRPMTMQEIGQALGVSRQRVEQYLHGYKGYNIRRSDKQRVEFIQPGMMKGFSKRFKNKTGSKDASDVLPDAYEFGNLSVKNQDQNEDI